jgi:hypothetical protein
MPAEAGIQLDLSAWHIPRWVPAFAGTNGKANYFRTYFCMRQFSVSATKISSRELTAM